MNLKIYFLNLRVFYFIFSSAGNCGTQPTAGSANRHRRDTRMSRGILSKIDQLLGQKPNKNVDGRVRLFYLVFPRITLGTCLTISSNIDSITFSIRLTVKNECFVKNNNDVMPHDDVLRRWHKFYRF